MPRRPLTLRARARAAGTRGASSRGGFTLVEMAVALVVVSVLGGLFFLTTQTTSSAVRVGVAVAELDAKTRRVLDRVCEALKETSADQATPQVVAPFAGHTVDLQRGLGVDGAGALVWGPVERFVLEHDEADDGADDDGDGLVDECRLVWIQSPGAADERRTVLCRDVREYLDGETFDGDDENGNGLIDERGFALDFAEERVTVRLTLAAVGASGQVLTSTAQRTVAFRNQGN